jgi:hypothetical protein
MRWPLPTTRQSPIEERTNSKAIPYFEPTRISIGNQTNKALVVVPNPLEPRLLFPRQMNDWHAFAFDVDVRVGAPTREGSIIELGRFSYDNVPQGRYSHIHIYPMHHELNGAAREFYTFYYYLSGDTIHPFGIIEKSIWDSLPSI